MAPPPAVCSTAAMGHVPCAELSASSVQGQSWPTDTLCCAGVAALPHQQALSKAERAKKNNHNFIGFTSRSQTPGAEMVLLQLTPSSRWLTMVPATRHPDLAASPRAGAGIPRKLPAGSSSRMHHAHGEKKCAETENWAFRRGSGITGLQH